MPDEPDDVPVPAGSFTVTVDADTNSHLQRRTGNPGMAEPPPPPPDQMAITSLPEQAPEPKPPKKK